MDSLTGSALLLSLLLFLRFRIEILDPKILLSYLRRLVRPGFIVVIGITSLSARGSIDIICSLVDAKRLSLLLIRTYLLFVLVFRHTFPLVTTLCIVVDFIPPRPKKYNGEPHKRPILLD
jgi:hypothetical protein